MAITRSRHAAGCLVLVLISTCLLLVVAAMEHVGLQYAPELPPALNDISFTLPRGQMLALVGPSSAIKSSIPDLLTGLYAPTAGQIWVNNTPLEQLELASWQHRLGVVSQDTFLFNATIAPNITICTPGASLSQMKAAC